MKKLLLTCMVLLQTVCATWAQDMIRSVELPDQITITVGQTVDLNDYVTISPEGAKLPSFTEWDFANASYCIKVENNKLTGLHLGNNLYLGLRIPYDTHVLTTYTWVEVKQVEPTAINIKSDHQSVSVYTGETEKLTKFLSEAYEIVPSNAPANVRWKAADESIVKYEDYWNNMQQYVEEYQPLKAGTTTMTAQIYDIDGKLKLTSTQTVKVTVLQPVEDLTINSNNNQEECNVGDDLTSYLNSIVKVYPENAYDKSVKWSILRDGDAVTISADGKIKAVKPGFVLLEVESVNNPDATAIVSVQVHNPASDIRFASETVSAVYVTEPVDISQKIKDNISFLPSDYETLDGFTVSSDRPNDVVAIDSYSYNLKTKELSVKARAIGVGKATITVSIDYADYLADYANPGKTGQRKKVSKSFVVNVTQGDIPVKSLRNKSGHNQEECNVGDNLTSYLNSLITVVPENAADKTFTWSIPAGSVTDVVTIGSDGKIKAVKPGSTTLLATSNNNREATATVSVLVHNPATDIRFASEKISAVYSTEPVDISQKVKDNISFLPSGYESVDGFAISSDRPNDIVAIDSYSFNQKTNELSVKARAIGVGKATITVSIDYHDYLSDYTNPGTAEHRTKVSKSFVVDVTQGAIPVKSVRNTSSRDYEECNVGDNLTSYLKSLIQVSPDNASDKSLKWSVVRGDAVTVSGDGTMKAVKAGTAVVQAASVDNPNATATITVLVHNPASDIRFTSETVGVVYVLDPVDISQKVKDNISFLPSGYESLEGLTITSDNTNNVVTIDDYSYNQKTNELSVKARAIGVGKATITVSIDYRDYLADYTSPAAAGHRTKVTKSFVVNVTQGEIPVQSLRNTSSHNVEECNVGDDLTSYLNSLITVLPERADDKTFRWSVAVGNAVEAVTIGADGVIKAVKAGQVTLVATSNNNPDATATVSVLVHNPAKDVQFATDVLDLEYYGRELDVSQNMKDNITFLPSGFESIEGLTIVSDRPNDIVTVDDVSYSLDSNELMIRARVLGEGEATITVSFNYRDYLSDYTNPATTEHRITVTKSFKVSVIEVIPPVSSVLYPDELTLSRYHDVMLQLTVEPENAILDPSLVEIRIGESANKGWGSAAVATPSAAAASAWNLRGRFVGDYPYQVYYDGQPQPTANGGRQGVIHIPAEYPLAQGWDWISLYATGKSGSLPLKTKSGWMAPMEIDDNNYVQEIRSQHELLYKDPETGFFGDIEQLSPSDGMYKVNSHYDASIVNQMILSAGSEGLVSSFEQRLPQARKGYTWITYPHELNHSLEALAPYLLQSAADGDMIIGRDMVVAYNGSEWLGADDCVFEAGKGYIYYTESDTPKTINWGPVTLAPDTKASKTRGEQASATPWTYNPYANPDCMAVIAQIKGLDNPQDYSIGAFVGDECRGQGKASAEGLFLVPVSGQSGDLVSFQLYHKPSRSYLTTSGQYRFVSHMGSVSSPLMLSATTTAIRTVGDGKLSINVSDDVIMVSGAVGETVLDVTDIQGKCVAACQGATLSIASLPSGIYIVRATDGSRQMIKKIKK